VLPSHHNCESSRLAVVWAVVGVAIGREKYGQTGVRTQDHPNLEGGATTAPPSW
jgi:hypothetical protein